MRIEIEQTVEHKNTKYQILAYKVSITKSVDNEEIVFTKDSIGIVDLIAEKLGINIESIVFKHNVV